MAAVRAGQAIYVADLEAEPGPKPLDPRSRSLVAVPLLAADQVIGVLVVESPRPNAFGRLDQEQVVWLATQAAIAIQNARLHGALGGLEARAGRVIEPKDPPDSV